MRGAALLLGVLMLLPGACSLVFMVGFGPLNSLRLMLGPFFSDNLGGYDYLALAIWGPSLLIGSGGIIIVRWALRTRGGAPPERSDDQKPG